MALTTQGKGAFRRFKDQLHKEHPGLLPAWYAFRDARLRGNALCRISQAASAETPASSAAAHIYATSAIWLLGPALHTGELILAEDGPVSWTAHADLAEAAAIALTDEGPLIPAR